MSSWRVLIGCNLSSALRRRLGASGVTSKSWLSSYNLAKQFHSEGTAIRSSGSVTLSRRKSEVGLPLLGQGLPLAKKIHASAVKNRNEAGIDESLNRLDVEIRRVGRVRRQEVDDILQDIKDMKKATSSQSLMIIRCCGELIPEEPPSKRTELVQQVWKTLENLKVPVDVSHYNALLRVYLENEHKFNPTEFLQDLTSKGVEPNRVTYQRLIARFCQDGDIDGASTILQHMKEKQMPINEYVFNALILGHGQANDMESAEGILGVMTQAGLEPNDDTYVTLMTCYAKHGDIENIHRIVKECGEKEIFLMDRDFLNVIYALAENNHHELIDSVLSYLKKHSGFNQEATNLIFRLVNIGQEECAYKILKQMTPLVRQDDTLPSGNFFIKHLVQLSRPAETIVKYCKALQDDGLHKYALHRACEAALQSKKFDLAMDLFEALRICGMPVRHHYFWPFLASAATESDVYYGLKCMKEFGLTPNTETLREYVIPNVLEKADNFEKSFQRLISSTGVSMNVLAPAAMLYLLNQGKIDGAADFAATHRLRFGNPQLRRGIVDAYLKSNKSKAFVKIIGTANVDGSDDSREYVGMMLMELVESIKSSSRKEAVLQPVLNELLANGLGLSNSGSELLQNSLGEALTPGLANLIIQLTSPELTPKVSFSTVVDRKSGSQLEDRSTEELEQMLTNAKENNLATKAIRKSLLYSYCRDKNFEKATKLKEELTKEDFVFPAGLQAMFLDLYVSVGKLEDAAAVYQEITKTLDFILDDIKLLRYAALLQSNGDFEGCVEVLKNTRRDESRKPAGAAQQAIVWNILNSLAESSTPEKTNEMFNILNERKLIPVNNVTLGPLIKAYLTQDDMPGALQEFERCVQEYRVTPFKQQLFCSFIKTEDADRLQKVMDLSMSIHGEVNSMYDLVFAFIDCGKIRQAKKILETPGLRARNDKIERYCQRYCEENKILELENLLQVTKDLVDLDRSSMYFYLLQAYCKQGDADKALSIWTSMQEENVQPSVELLIYLADFLRKNNQPVPFVVPESSELTTAEDYTGTAAVGLPKSISEFRQHIDVNDVDKALQIKQRMEAEGITLSLTDTTHLIERLARAERLNEATRLTDQLLDQGLYPLMRTFRFLVARLGAAGDVNTLERMDEKLSYEAKRSVMLNTKLCLAYSNANRGAEYFENRIKKVVLSGNDLDDKSSNATGGDTAEDADEIGNVPVFGTTNLLIRNENLVNECEDLASKAKPIHKKSLYNALWGYYMTKKDYARAEEIWESHLKHTDRVLFRSIVMEAKTNNDAELAKAVCSQVMKAEHLANRAKSVPCCFTMDILLDNGRVDEALKFLEESFKYITIDDYPMGAVQRFKEKVETANKKFPFQIPAPRRTESRRRAKADSSDSDSD